MQPVSNDTFGPLIAYLVPGATALVGLSPYIPTVQSWLAGTTTNAPTIGGLLYLSAASLAVGMTVSAIRWAFVDWIHERTGLQPPKLDFSRLPGKVDELRLLIEIHYRHYQFYSNMFVAVAIGYVSYRLHCGLVLPGLADLAVIVLEPIFFLTSRDTLHKYYTRSALLFSSS